MNKKLIERIIAHLEVLTVYCDKRYAEIDLIPLIKELRSKLK